MKKGKRFFAAVAAASLVATLAACGQKDGGDTGAAGGAKVEQFSVYTPTTMAFGAPMNGFGTNGEISKYVKDVKLDNWKSANDLKTLLGGGKAQLAATPAYVAANLYNKKIDVRYVAQVVWGMLYVIGPDGAKAGDWSALKGKRVAIAMPGNMPDLVFSYLLSKNKMSKSDFEVVNVEDGRQIVGMLASGQVDFAVIPEHLATIALAKSKQAGKSYKRVLNLQEEWAKVNGGEPRIPMAGVVMPAKLADGNPKLVGAVLSELEANVKKANDGDGEFLKSLAKNYKLPEPMVKGIIPRLNLKVVAGADAKAEYEVFLKALGEVNPKIYGGKLPDAKFYVSDPRK